MLMPAAGHWKGSYRIIVEMRGSVVLPFVSNTKLEGSLEFDLARYEAPFIPSPAPPSDLLRRPLVWAWSPEATREARRQAWKSLIEELSAEGTDVYLTEDREKILEETTEEDDETTEEDDDALGNAVAQRIFEETLAEDDDAQKITAKTTAEDDGNYQGLKVGPNDNPKIKGKATYNRQDSINMTTSGGSINDSGSTSAPLPLEVRAEEDSASGEFKEIGLWGFPDQMAYGGNVEATTSGGTTQGQLDIDGGTGNYHDGTRSVTVTSDVSPPPLTALVTLNVVHQECGLMQGTVQSSQLVNTFGSAGFEAVVTDSEWTATLDEQDVDFEQSVKALADEPIPSPLTWDYIDHFQAQWQSLRKSGKLTDYRLCVLSDLDAKAVAITVAGLQELLNDFPKVRDMDNACHAITVVDAALERIFPLVRRLQLEGISCPDTDSWTDVVNKEMQDLVKNTLGREHTFEELTCLAGWYFHRYGGFSYGDQDDLLMKLWLDALNARLNGREPPP